MTFGDAEGLGQRKQTRREVFLGEMDQVVPWKVLLALIEPHYPTLGRPGRQPYPLATMLRIHFLQQWYALSDPAMEEALYETPVMRRFAQLGGLDAVPDETTILHFRRLLDPMIENLREADKAPVAEVAKKHGVSEQTPYLWRKRYGPLEAADVEALRGVQQDRARLKKILVSGRARLTQSAVQN